MLNPLKRPSATSNLTTISKIVLLIVVADLPQSEAILNDNTEIGGYIMLDHDYRGPFYDKTSQEYQHNSEIRRSKLGIKYSPNSAFQSKLQIKYSRQFPESGSLSLGDAYLRLEHPSRNALQFGKMKQPFSLQQLTSSSAIGAIERSLPTSAFSPGRSIGLQFDRKKKRYTLATGYFIDRETEDEFSLNNFDIFKLNNGDIEAATLRATCAPYLKKSLNLHLGFSTSKQWFNGKKIQFKERGEVHSADSIIRSARFYAQSGLLYQFEFAYQAHNTLIQAELFSNIITPKNNTNWHFKGGYVQLRHHFSGNYRYKYGKYKSSKYQHQGFEFILRQSYLDLREHEVGSEASISLIGLNYSFNKYFKLMANTTIPWISGDTINNNTSGHGYSVRGQFNF